METKSTVKRTPFSIDAILTRTKSSPSTDDTRYPVTDQSVTSLSDGLLSQYQDKHSIIRNTHLLSPSFLSQTENSLSVLEQLSRRALHPGADDESHPAGGFLPVSAADRRTLPGLYSGNVSGDVRRGHSGVEHGTTAGSRDGHSPLSCREDIEDDIDVTSARSSPPGDIESEYSCEGSDEEGEFTPQDLNDPLHANNNRSFTNTGRASARGVIGEGVGGGWVWWWSVGCRKEKEKYAYGIIYDIIS